MVQFRAEVEHFLETDGINLKAIMCFDGVDWKRAYSNSCVEIFEVLGIEAARAAVMKELREAFQFGGSTVNYRHLALLCDVMAHRGKLMAITRHGINRTDTGALMRCSFEETVEILMEAAAMGEKDDCHGIAENVMFGQMAPMGTGAFDVALDMDMLKDVIVDHRLPVQNMLAARTDGGMTPGQVAMTPYDSNSPMWSSEMPFRGEQAAFSPLAGNGSDNPSDFSVFGLRAKSNGRGRNVSWSGIQSELSERLLANLTICSPVAVRWRNVSIWHVAIRNVAILQPCWWHVPNVLPNVACVEPDFPWLFSNESAVLTDVAIVLPDFTALQSAITIPLVPLRLVIRQSSPVFQSGVSQM